MKRKALITLILGTVLVVAPAAHAVVLSDGGGSNSVSTVVPSTGLSPAEYQALFVRGEALNEQYGTSTTLSPAEYRALKFRGEALNRQYGSGTSTTLSPAEYRALKLRGEALNAQYGTSVTIRPDILGGDGGSVATSGSSSFEWGKAIPATLLGVMLIAAASLAITRRRVHRVSF